MAKLRSVFCHQILQSLVSSKLIEEFLATEVFLLIPERILMCLLRFVDFFLLPIGKPAALGHLYSCLFSLHFWRGGMLVNRFLDILLQTPDSQIDGHTLDTHAQTM